MLLEIMTVNVSTKGISRWEGAAAKWEPLIAIYSIQHQLYIIFLDNKELRIYYSHVYADPINPHSFL